MNLAELERKLFAAARRQPPVDQVPYAFEKRVMARLRPKAILDTWGFWSRALWRAVAPCVALTLVLSAWSYFSAAGTQAGDLSQDLENAIFAAADQDSPPAETTR